MLLEDNMGLDFGTFATSTLAIAGTMVNDLSPYLTLVVGVTLGLLVVVFLIRAITRH